MKYQQQHCADGVKKRRLKQCKVQEGKYCTAQTKSIDIFKRKDKRCQQEKGCVMPKSEVGVSKMTSRDRWKTLRKHSEDERSSLTLEAGSISSAGISRSF
jgi:hypothetical protein